MRDILACSWTIHFSVLPFCFGCCARVCLPFSPHLFACNTNQQTRFYRSRFGLRSVGIWFSHHRLPNFVCEFLRLVAVESFFSFHVALNYLPTGLAGLASPGRSTSSMIDMSAASLLLLSCSFSTRVYPPGRLLHHKQSTESVSRSWLPPKQRQCTTQQCTCIWVRGRRRA